MFLPEQFDAFSLQSHPPAMSTLASAKNAVDAGAAVKNHLREPSLPPINVPALNGQVRRSGRVSLKEPVKSQIEPP
jgi:hypothetical protein